MDGAALVGRLFPEGVPEGLLRDVLSSAGGDQRRVLAGSLQLPEYQFI